MCPSCEDVRILMSPLVYLESALGSGFDPASCECTLREAMLMTQCGWAPVTPVGDPGPLWPGLVLAIINL